MDTQKIINTFSSDASICHESVKRVRSLSSLNLNQHSASKQEDCNKLFRSESDLHFKGQSCTMSSTAQDVSNDHDSQSEFSDGYEVLENSQFSSDNENSENDLKIGCAKIDENIARFRDRKKISTFPRMKKYLNKNSKHRNSIHVCVHSDPKPILEKREKLRNFTLPKTFVRKQILRSTFLNRRPQKHAENNNTCRSFSWLRKSMKMMNPVQMPHASNNDQNFRDATESNSIEIENELAHITSNDQIIATTTTTDIEMNSFSSSAILNRILLEEQRENNDALVRPRQFGRRSNPSFRIASTNQFDDIARITAHHQNGSRSSPSRMHHDRSESFRRSMQSELSSPASSRNPSPVSIVSSTASSSIAESLSIDTSNQRNQNIFTSNQTDDNDETNESDTTKEYWDYFMSRPVSCVFCCLGLFNISRFAIFTVHFGANFLVQFMILSLLFGIPMLWLLIVIGSKIKGGVVTMFRVTPICKGIGLSLLLAQCIMSLFSAITIGWILIYLKDSFISSESKYMWQESYDLNRRGYQNGSTLPASLTDYFNGVVLQRSSSFASDHRGGTMRFQLAFNVSIVWFFVFVVLCQGIKSLGRIIFGMFAVGMLGLITCCIKLLSLMEFQTIQSVFPATDWEEFFINSNCWYIAAQETFLTWSLSGVSIYTIYCKSIKKQGQNQLMIKIEAIFIVLLTFFGLFLAALLGSTCVQILKTNGFSYVPASYENARTDLFLWPSENIPLRIRTISSKYISRYSTLLGESFKRPTRDSGYKPLRLITELLPATLAVSNKIERFWGYLIFTSLLFMGLGQLSLMWKPICGAIGKSPSAVLLSCVTGLFLGFPLVTDNGIEILYFMDFIFGGAWWLPLIWSSFICAIFMIRGQPFTSDVLIKDLRFNETFSAFIAFSWNLLLPVGLIFLSVMEYKMSFSNELFHYHVMLSNSLFTFLNHWPVWAKKLGALSQLFFILLIPVVAIIQIVRYLRKGPPDILERIELLYRPPMGEVSYVARNTTGRRFHDIAQQTTVDVVENANAPVVDNDTPPKYSPPPSYSTATGKKILIMLRQSFRRSARRVNRPTTTSNEVNLPSSSQCTSSVENLIN